MNVVVYYSESDSGSETMHYFVMHILVSIK